MGKSHGHRSWRPLVLAGDLTLGAVALVAAFWLRIRFPMPGSGLTLPPERLALLAMIWPLALAAQTLALYLVGFYDPPRPLPRLELARRLGLAALLQALGLSTLFFLGGAVFPRSVLLLELALAGVALYGWRWLMQRTPHLELRRVAIVGCGRAARELAEAIDRHHWHGLRVVGHVAAPGEAVDRGPSRDERAAELGPDLGSIEALGAMLSRGELDDLIFAADPLEWRTEWFGRLASLRPPQTSILLLPGPFESLIGRMRYRWVHDLPLIEVVRDREWPARQPVKRAFDLLAGGVLLLLASPLLGLCMLAVRWTSPGPVLYRQRRVGQAMRPFELFKLRTMREDAERESGEVLAQPDDPRLTPVGGLLRRMRLDEIPQLVNVLRGEMSLVGPRPERPGFVERYLAEVPGYVERFTVLPGLTGLAQVNGDYHSSAGNKLRYDLAYIANWSLWLDLSVLFRTAKTVLTSRGV